MSLDHDIVIMVREMLAGNACVSATRWSRVAMLSASVLRHKPGGPHLPPGPFLLPCGRGRRKAGCGNERILATSHAMVAQARYVPDEKSLFLIRLLGLFNVFTLPGRGTERGERNESSKGGSLTFSTIRVAVFSFPFRQRSPHATLLALFMSLAYGRGRRPTRNTAVAESTGRSPDCRAGYSPRPQPGRCSAPPGRSNVCRQQIIHLSGFIPRNCRGRFLTYKQEELGDWNLAGDSR